MRGEYGTTTPAASRKNGSSPHAWGIRALAARQMIAAGFIPTCVGNTEIVAAGLILKTVHPHMRGEYMPSAMAAVMQRGSSPHAWGIPGSKSACAGRGRFIPTCVGNTPRSSRTPDAGPVHPHMRGEYSEGEIILSSVVGSSPHAWGIRVRFDGQFKKYRFIPTCVGNTEPALPKPEDAPVHPHMRGEYESHARDGQPQPGSSPHAWGILWALA